MTNGALVPIGELQAMANAFAESGLFAKATPSQCLALLLLANGEGMHPAIAMRDFDIINGKPAKKAEAMHRAFLAAGGTVEWHKLDDEGADATFSHPQGGTARISWDAARAKKAGLSGKDMYAKYGRQMYRSRVISEGCRTVYPAATSGLYEPGEVRAIAKEKDMGKAEVVEEATPLNVVLDAIAKMTRKAERAEAKALADRLTDADQIARAEAAWAERIAELKQPTKEAQI